MPIELKPTEAAWTRRQVLAAGAAVGAGGALGLAGCNAATYTTGSDPNVRAHDRVLILSDTHINADPTTTSRQGVNMAERLDTVLRATRDEVGTAGRPWGPKGQVFQLDYDFALLNGDAAHLDGQPGDYGTLVDGLAPLRELGVPVHITLGNHDDREHFRRVLDMPPDINADATAPAGKHVCRLGAEDGSRHADWLLLDSLWEVNKTPGELGGDQLRWLDEQLTANAPRPTLIVVHHPPVPDDPDRNPFALQDYAPFWAIVEAHPHVRAVFHGHTHHWDPRPRTVEFADGTTRDVPLIGLPPTSYVFHEGDPWGYVVADLDAAGMTLTLRAMDGHAADGETVRIAWA